MRKISNTCVSATYYIVCEYSQQQNLHLAIHIHMYACIYTYAFNLPVSNTYMNTTTNNPLLKY